jgi:hypothetical protein
MLDDLADKMPINFYDPLLEALSGAANATLILATLLTVFSGVVYLAKYWNLFMDEEEK